jgi:hypothetical protein
MHVCEILMPDSHIKPVSCAQYVRTDGRTVNLRLKSRFNDQCQKEHKHVRSFPYTSSYGASLGFSVARSQEAKQNLFWAQLHILKVKIMQRLWLTR